MTGGSTKSNGISQTGSLVFAAGPCYENPDNAAFYENPLAAPKVPHRGDSLEDHHGGIRDSSVYDDPSSPTGGSGIGLYYLSFHCSIILLSLCSSIKYSHLPPPSRNSN